MTFEESNDLVSFYRFAGESTNIEILHYHPMMMHYGCMGYLRNYHGMNFYKMMEKIVFSGVSQNEIQVPEYTDDNEFIDVMFRKNYLKEGKTVLLAPHANSLINFPIIFWEKLVKALNEKGYTVCTNSSGMKEPPIIGTCPVFVPYKYLNAFIKKAGYVVSYRSGFSDILSGLEGKKIVLYAKQELYNIMGGLGSVYEYFSLNEMELCNDAIEYEILIDSDEAVDRNIKMIMMNF